MFYEVYCIKGLRATLLQGSTGPGCWGPCMDNRNASNHILKDLSGRVTKCPNQA